MKKSSIKGAEKKGEWRMDTGEIKIDCEGKRARSSMQICKKRRVGRRRSARRGMHVRKESARRE
jgi:hypothetical protein